MYEEQSPAVWMRSRQGDPSVEIGRIHTLARKHMAGPRLWQVGFQGRTGVWVQAGSRLHTSMAPQSPLRRLVVARDDGSGARPTPPRGQSSTFSSSPGASRRNGAQVRTGTQTALEYAQR